MLGLEGRLQELEPLLRAQYIETLVNNWQLWIPAQFINFRFVPVQHQVLLSLCFILFCLKILSLSGRFYKQCSFGMEFLVVM